MFVFRCSSFLVEPYDYIVAPPTQELPSQFLWNGETGSNKLIFGWTGTENEYSHVPNLVTLLPAYR